MYCIMLVIGYYTHRCQFVNMEIVLVLLPVVVLYRHIYIRYVSLLPVLSKHLRYGKTNHTDVYFLK